MKSRSMLLALIGVIALSAGCRVCQSPYDYCGPTFTGDPGTCCSRDGRANSILSEQIDYNGCPLGGGCQSNHQPTPAQPIEMQTQSPQMSRIQQMPQTQKQFPTKSDLERIEGGPVEIISNTDLMLDEPVNAPSEAAPDGAHYQRKSSYRPARNAARWHARPIR